MVLKLIYLNFIYLLEFAVYKKFIFIIIKVIILIIYYINLNF